MRFNRAVIALLAAALLSAPAQGFGGSPDRPRSTPTIVISFDGAQPEVIENMIRSGRLPRTGGFAKLIDDGAKADGMTSVLPTVTATNHITLATGAYVERTNIPGNTFHLTDTALTATTSGFGTEIEAAFSAINDPVTNERIFEIILKKPREEDMLHKKSRFGDDDTGDVITVPGYNLDFNEER